MTREDEIREAWKSIVKKPWKHVTEEAWGYGTQSWIEPISSRPMGHVYASEETLKVHAAIARAPEDIAYLSSRVDFYKQQATADRVQIEGLQAENQRLREALRFYADTTNYDGLSDYYSGESLEASNILLDGGSTARQALQPKEESQ